MPFYGMAPAVPRGPSASVRNGVRATPLAADAEGRGIDDCGLPDPRLADQDRVVLVAAAQPTCCGPAIEEQALSDLKRLMVRDLNQRFERYLRLS